MEAKEFAITLLEESGYQFNACLKDISDEDFDRKPIERLMSIREMLEHVLEVFVAIDKSAKGEKHDWGNFTAPQLSKSELLAHFSTEREKAVATALEHFDAMPFLASDFLVAHEFYHVGQMVGVRRALDESWNSYSIYRH